MPIKHAVLSLCHPRFSPFPFECTIEIGDTMYTKVSEKNFVKNNDP